MIIQHWLVIIILVLFPLATLNAQTEKPILRKKPVPVLIGDRWWTGKSSYKAADVWIYSTADKEDWSYMRLPSVDEKRSTYRNVVFPLSTAKEYQYDFEVLVTVSAKGKITECRYDPHSRPDIGPDTSIAPDLVLEPTAIEHACPLLKEHVQFFPGLNTQGERAERKGKLSIFYSLSWISTKKNKYPPPISTVSMTKGTSRKPEPVDDIGLETLGLTEKMLKDRGLTTIFARLKIDASGKAIGCRLGAATNDDMLDRQICEKASALKYLPGIGDDGNARQDDYYLFVFTEAMFEG
jgi:hypothetical protein